MPYLVLRPLFVIKGSGIYVDPTTRQFFWRSRRSLVRIWPWIRHYA